MNWLFLIVCIAAIQHDIRTSVKQALLREGQEEHQELPQGLAEPGLGLLVAFLLALVGIVSMVCLILSYAR